MAELKYKRVLLKLSGEALAGEKQIGIDPHTVSKICAEIADVVDMGLEVALVIGGGNIFRGLSASAEGMDRSSADYMGMLATVLNALAVQDALEKTGHPTRVLSAIAMQEVCEPYVRRRAMRHLEKGPRDHLRRRDGQSVLHHGHRGGSARHGAQVRRHHQGHQGRRRL